MWHEARQQEKKIREVMVDLQKRAERRREHYEKMRGDPNQLIRLTGTKCRMHLDPTGGVLDSSMIPWQGDPDNLISRYDVRMHLDVIPDYSSMPEQPLSRDQKNDETKCNYERYRELVKHTFEGVGEAEVLARIDAEEMYPPSRKNKDKQRLAKNKAAIGFTYGDTTTVRPKSKAKKSASVENEEDESSTDEYDIDMDVERMDSRKIDRLNVLALEYGISSGHFSKTLRTEKLILLERKEAKLAEAEKSAFCGKKARRERRLLKEMMLRERRSTPPSYARRGSPTYEPYEPLPGSTRGRSSSPSGSSDADGEVTFITEFGGDSIETRAGTQSTEPSSRPHITSPTGAAYSSNKHSYRSERSSRRDRYPRSHRSRSRSRSRERNYKSRRLSHRPVSGSSQRSNRSNRSRSRSRDHQRSRHHSSSSSSSPSRSHSSPSPEHVKRFRRTASSGAPFHSHDNKPEAKPNADIPARQPDTKKLKDLSGGSTGKLGSSKIKGTGEKSKMTPQERLKRKMQSMLNKTYKQEKKTEREKAVARESERLEREEELRDELRKKRERERSRWEREQGYDSDGPYW